MDSYGPRFAPEDPTLPSPWKGLVDGATGVLYYWNPDTNVTQYEKPTALTALPPLPEGPARLSSTPTQATLPGNTIPQSSTLQQYDQQMVQGWHQIQEPSSNVMFQQVDQQQQQQLGQQVSLRHQLPQETQQMPQQQVPLRHQLPQETQQMPQQQVPLRHQLPQETQHMPRPQVPLHHQLPQENQQMPQQQVPLRHQLLQETQQQQVPLRHQLPQETQQLPQQRLQQIPNQQGMQQQLQYQNMPQYQAQYNQTPFTQGQGQQNVPYPYSGQHLQVSQDAFHPGKQVQQGGSFSHHQQEKDSLNVHQQVPTSQAPQFSHSLGLQISPQQAHFEQGFHARHQQGQQPPQTAHYNTPLEHQQQRQQVSVTKFEEFVSEEGKQPSLLLPSKQQGAPLPSNQFAGSGTQLQMNLSQGGGQPVQVNQLLGGSSPNISNSVSYAGSSVQIRDAVPDTGYWQPQPTNPMAQSRLGPSPVHTPVSIKRSDSFEQFGRVGTDLYSRNDGSPMLSQPPKLAALPPIRSASTNMDVRTTPFLPSHLTGFDATPVHTLSMHSNGAFPSEPGLYGLSESANTSAIDAYRQLHELTTMGESIPAPLMTFEATGFPPEILREIHLAGFVVPTPIQAQTWPVALQRRDIVAIAKTGSGKTLGYLIPAFILLRCGRNDPKMGPTVLVLAPTRELASQIQDEALKFGRTSRISCTCLYGGVPKGVQLREIERGPDIIVATPGRLNDFLEMKKVNLRQVSLLVLDEADRMLDMGFEPQIRKIVNEIPSHRQTLMYTATWPKEVRKIAGDLLRNPVQVNIGRVDELAANKSITQYVEFVQPFDKQRRLEQILRTQERGSRVIIFCSTKKLCDQLAYNIGRTFGAAAIHGDKSQNERDNILNHFRTGKAPILVATDVAARGLDIKDIRVVINYDFPTGIEDYVHRIGRTGRAGASGVSYTFFSEQDWKFAPDLIKILEGAGQHVPRELHEMVARGGPPMPRNQMGASRWDSSADGSYGSGRGNMRDVPAPLNAREGPGAMGFGGRAGGRAGGRRGGGPNTGNFGGRGFGPNSGNFGGRGGGIGGPNSGVFGGRSGPSSGFSGRGGDRGGEFYGGRGSRGRGFRGPSGPVGRGFHDRGQGDRYNSSDGRGRYDVQRGYGDRRRDRSYSPSPDRARSKGYYRDRVGSRSRSRSRGRSRSRSRSWTRSRSRSQSRSWSRSRSPGRSYSRSRSRSNDRYRQHDKPVDGAIFLSGPMGTGVVTNPDPGATGKALVDAASVPVLQTLINQPEDLHPTAAPDIKNTFNPPEEQISGFTDVDSSTLACPDDAKHRDVVP